MLVKLIAHTDETIVPGEDTAQQQRVHLRANWGHAALKGFPGDLAGSMVSPMLEHQFDLAREIYEREAPKIVFWESERVMDMVMGYLIQWESDGLRSPELMDWLGRFRDDKDATVKAYWKAVYNGIKSAFKDGADAIPDTLTPGQQKKKLEA